MQGKRQCRWVVWIVNWALQMHRNPRVLLGVNKLLSKDWSKGDHRGLQRIYVIWFSFFIWAKVLLDLLSLSNFFSLNPLPPYIKIVCFLFRTVKKDWVWTRNFGGFITNLKCFTWYWSRIFLELASIFEKVDSNFEGFSTK